MPRYSKRQQEALSCGAATLLVALRELGRPVLTTNDQEAALYAAIKIPDGSPGAGETLPSSILSYAQNEGLRAEIIESPQTAGLFGAKAMYQLYRYTLGTLGINPTSREPADADMDNNGRLFLVVKFNNSDSTHYVLARKDGGLTYLMNPDPGSDDQLPLPAFNDPLSTNRNGVIVHNGGSTANDGGRRGYVFTGIAVRVWPP